MAAHGRDDEGIGADASDGIHSRVDDFINRHDAAAPGRDRDPRARLNAPQATLNDPVHRRLDVDRR